MNVYDVRWSVPPRHLYFLSLLYFSTLFYMSVLLRMECAGHGTVFLVHLFQGLFMGWCGFGDTVIGHPIKRSFVLQQSQPRPSSPPLHLAWRCGRLGREGIGLDRRPGFSERFARIANRTVSDSFRSLFSSLI